MGRSGDRAITKTLPLLLVLCAETRRSDTTTIVGIFTTPEAAAAAIIEDIAAVTGTEILIEPDDVGRTTFSVTEDGMQWTATTVTPDKRVAIAHHR